MLSYNNLQLLSEMKTIAFFFHLIHPVRSLRKAILIKESRPIVEECFNDFIEKQPKAYFVI